MYKFQFSCIDNGGYRQNFIVKASNKLVAIDKALKKATKNAKGDITTWECKLVLVF